MKYIVSAKTVLDIKCDSLCLPYYSDTKLSDAAKLFDEQHGKLLSKKIKQYKFSGKTGQLCEISLSSDTVDRVLLIGLGESKALDKDGLTKSIQALAKTLAKGPSPKAALCLTDLHTEMRELAAQQLIRSIGEEQYTFATYKTTKPDASPLKETTLLADKAEQAKIKQVVSYTQALVAGMNTTKDLGNQPGNVCTPSFLAKSAEALAKQSDNMSIKVLEEKDMEKLNMGAFLSVSKGSTERGKMIILEYRGDKKTTPPHVLVGKGITFDTGGISLKPGAQMDEMKYDMCGAASVLGVMTALQALQPKINVIGVIAAAENMPAGNASKPGDIVTTSSGQTVEILNTDAEGRLVLCDALTYVERFKPATVVDIATLTGACIVALGHCTSAVMSNDQALADALLEAGQQAQDKAWQLPLWEEYQSQLDSPFADMQNIGGKGAGSITAGCFLARFAKAYKWAHLDIAGTAWVSGGKDKGATGRPVPLLLQYLMNQLDN